MKKIKLFGLVLLTTILYSLSYSNYQSNYNPPIMDGSIKFTAVLKYGVVYTKWTKFNKNEGFKYYKVIRSQTEKNPVYPDNGYIKYSTDINYLSYKDLKPLKGTTYYRVCAITTNMNRYCSNVVKIYNIQNMCPTVAYPIIKCKTGEKMSPIYKNECLIGYKCEKIQCTMEYAPVCGQPQNDCTDYGMSMNRCHLGAKWNNKPTTYSNICMLKNAGAKFLYYGKCKVVEPSCPENFPDPIALCGKNGKVIVIKKDENGCAIKYGCKTNISYKLKSKIDKLLKSLFSKIEKKFNTTEKRIWILNKIKSKLKNLRNKKPKYTDLINYINTVISNKIEEYKGGLGDIVDIFKGF